jgi:hypothetical protein
MAGLEIPEEYQEGLAQLISLSDDSFQELLSGLESAPFALKYRAVAANAAKRIKTIPEEDVQDAVEILVTLNIVRSGVDVSDEEFLNDLCDALNASEVPELQVTNENSDKVKQRILLLLNTKSVEVASKARALQIEHERRYCSARILTDIRPVFGTNPEERPVAAVVTNTLRLTYHQGPELKEFFIVLNAEELRKLGSAVERAEKKAEGLKSVLDSASVYYLE